MTPPKTQDRPVDADKALQLARETLEIEAAAVLGLRQRIGDDFAKAVALMLQVEGRVVVMGMGKSGHIGRKMVATLAARAAAFGLSPIALSIL